MAVTISLPGALASYAEGRRRLAIEPPFTTVGQALDQVWRLYPGLRDRVLTEEGAVRRHVNVFVGTESIRDTGGLGTPVVDGLELAIIPAVSGGAGESVRRTGRFSKPGTEWRVYLSSNDAAIAASRTNGGRIMQATTVQAPPEVVRAFVQEYFDAWKGTDEDKILAYYSDDVVIHLPTGTLEGKTAVRDNFVRPFIGAFPGNVHAIRNLAHETNLVAVEWSFEAMHTGPFANVQATGRQVRVPGCSFYEYDLSSKAITAGRIYFDLGTLLRQIGAAA